MSDGIAGAVGVPLGRLPTCVHIRSNPVEAVHIDPGRDIVAVAVGAVLLPTAPPAYRVFRPASVPIYAQDADGRVYQIATLQPEILVAAVDQDDIVGEFRAKLAAAIKTRADLPEG